MASGRSSADRDRAAGAGAHGRRDVWGVAVVALGLVLGAVVLRKGAPPAAEPEPPRPSASADPRWRPTPPAGATGGSTDVSPKIPDTMPRTRAGKLRALKALGITPTKGPDGKPQIDAAPVIRALNDLGVHDGIAAFPPPGTDPPKVGIIVPDDFELPEGYVRHYQSTDDGKPLPPILMFHPDYTFTDEQGNAVAIPPDRVVPADMVPPGFPVQMLEIPSRDARGR